MTNPEIPYFQPDDGGPAFATTTRVINGVHNNSTGRLDGQIVATTGGMSLRDYFAAHAPEPPERWHGGDRGVQDIIDWRWYYADAMLKARQA
jgi:hypothetical protein